jgi:hypothetical protein
MIGRLAPAPKNCRGDAGRGVERVAQAAVQLLNDLFAPEHFRALEALDARALQGRGHHNIGVALLVLSKRGDRQEGA